MAECEELALRAAERDAGLAAAWILAAKAAERQGRLGQAVEYLREVDMNRAEGVRARVDEADVLIRLGRLLEAGNALDSAAHASPDDVALQKRAVHLLMVTGRRHAALPHLMEIVRSGRFSDGELRLLGDLTRVVEDTPFLEKAIEQCPDDPGALLGLAEAARTNRRSDEARRLYEQVLRSAPELDEAWAGLGMLARDADEFAAWERSLPDRPIEHPDLWYARGRAAFERRDLRAAARCAWEAARRDSEHQQAHYLAGQALLALQDESRARDFVKRAELLQHLSLALDSVFQNPRHPGPMREAARLTESLGRFWEAYGWAGLVLTVRPQDDFARALVDRIRPQLNPETPRTIAETLPAARIDLSDFPLPAKVPSLPSHRSETDDVAEIRFDDVADEAGIHFIYDNGRHAESPTARIVETTGGGVAVLDYDQDARPDLYFTQGGQWPRPSASQPHSGAMRPIDRMFRNQLGQRFDDTTELSGLGDADYSQGAAAGDFDNDGFPDLYVANLGPNRLYRNNGDGTFSEVTEAAGLSGELWTTSCLLADLNGDGWPDLYDVNYCAGDLEKFCDGDSCSPRAFDAVVDQVWLSRGDGTFENVTDSCGVDVPKGYGLGIVAARFDDDAPLGLFIANDEVPNFFFANQAQKAERPKYQEQASLRGLAVNGNGSPQACMGVAAGDADGDGRIDLLVTNFFREGATLYLQEYSGGFVDRTQAAGLYEPTLQKLGFGAQFLDADRDGWIDVVIANGHIDDYRRKGIPYAMEPQFFRNTGGGKFRELEATALGEYFQRKWLGRGLARLDWNGDGLEDFAVSHIGAPAVLAANRTQNAGRYLAVQLSGTTSSRDAVGAVLHVNAGQRRWTVHLSAGDGYQASNERVMHVGLGDVAAVDSLEVHWPSGARQTYDTPPLNRRWLLVEGSAEMIEINLLADGDPSQSGLTHAANTP